MNKKCFDLKNLMKEEKFKKLEKEYLEYLHELECIVCYSGVDIEVNNELKNTLIAHHENLSECFSGFKRVTDFTAVPLCEYHHKIRHKDGFNVYEKWFKDERFIFAWSFTILEMFFEKKNLFTLKNKVSMLIDNIRFSGIDILTLKKEFDSLLLEVAYELSGV